MNRCSTCGCDLIKHHILETKVILNICIDNSLETVEETVKRHFADFL